MTPTYLRQRCRQAGRRRVCGQTLLVVAALAWAAVGCQQNTDAGSAVDGSLDVVIHPDAVWSPSDGPTDIRPHSDFVDPTVSADATVQVDAAVGDARLPAPELCFDELMTFDGTVFCQLGVSIDVSHTADGQPHSFLVGSVPYDDPFPDGSPGCGVSVYGLPDGRLRHRVTGVGLGEDGATIAIGVRVSRLEDIDADGVPDMAVSARASSQVIVLSGATGAVLRRFRPDAESETFGIELASAGDWDGDGVGDVAVGDDSVGGPHDGAPGHLWIFGGRSGEVIHHFRGSDDRDWYGGVVITDDVGPPEGETRLIVTANGATGPDGEPSVGRLELRRVPEVAPALEIYGDVPRSSGWGGAVTWVDDRDEDGERDLAIGAFGALRLYSSSTGAFLAAPQPVGFCNIGFRVVSVGDWTGDGVDEIVGSCIDNTCEYCGLVVVFDGADGHIRAVLGEGYAGHFGWALAVVSDLTGDGRSELLVGAPETNIGDAGRAGRVYVLSPRDCASP